MSATTTTTSARPEEQGHGSRRAQVVEALAGRYRLVPVLVAIVLIWVFFEAQTSAFLTPRNLTNLSVQIVVTAMLALGLVLILVIKEIDLSVAALSAVCAAVMAHLMVARELSAVVAIPAGLAVGMGVGAVQGAVVTRFRSPSFIVTLGTSLAMQGVVLMLLPLSGAIPLSGTAAQPIANTFLAPVVGYALALLGTVVVAALAWQSTRHQQRQGVQVRPLTSVVLPTAGVLVVSLVVVAVLNSDRGLPVPVALLLVVLAVAAYVTTQTSFGTYLYAIGGNAEAAKRAAIDVGRVRVVAFVLAGGIAALAGVVAASQTLGVSAQSGSGTLLLEAVAAAVIGGASLFGGRGSVWAALIGALLIGSISNGLALLSATTQTKYVVEGIVLVIAVSIDSVLSREARRS